MSSTTAGTRVARATKPRRRRLTLADLQAHATKRGGTCLATSYQGAHTPVLWSCGAAGHQPWRAIPNSVMSKKDTWCRECYRDRVSPTLADLQAYAAKKGGTCLATAYVNYATPVEWSCGVAGHRPWRASPNNVMGKQDTWCRKCRRGRARHTLADLQAHAARKGGACLATTYVDASTPVEWSCGVAGHRPWRTSPNNVMRKKGTWCRECHHDQGRPRLADLQAHAAKKGGICLATPCRTTTRPVLWSCGVAGHQPWCATPRSVMGEQDTWCPTCSSGRGERQVRHALEHLTGRLFPSAHPTWLPGMRGRLLELDGYCETLDLAFEHHGAQHYRHIAHFHRSAATFHAQQQRDVRKRALCQARGVRLLEVPEVGTLTKLTNLGAFVADWLHANGISMVATPATIDYATARSLRTHRPRRPAGAANTRPTPGRP